MVEQTAARLTSPATVAARSSTGARAGAIALAALSLPGVWAPTAHAETPPENGLIALKYLRYEDSQPGFQRITVDAPSLYLLTPVGTRWSLEGSLVVDSLSGATPRWQTAVSSASVMDENRTAGDVKVTRYFDRSSYALGLSTSHENDYVSNALSFNGSWSSDDSNTTWSFGAAGSSDRINPTGGGVENVRDKTKKTGELMVGLTRVLSSVDILQLNLSYSQGRGYYDDPYKVFDTRPDERRQAALLGRWNHHFGADASTLRASYRFYQDSFGITAHTLQGEWAKPVTSALTLTPSLRLYTQSAANFYFPASYRANGDPVFPVLQAGQLNSGDQRLSAFGAAALAVKAQYGLDANWTTDARFEVYEQRGSWRAFGTGSTKLDPLRARSLQIGLSRRF